MSLFYLQMGKYFYQSSEFINFKLMLNNNCTESR